MPRIREIVVDGEICHTRRKVVEKYGGNEILVYKTLHAGEHLYLGHHIEYLRHEVPPALCIFPKLDQFVHKYKSIKKRPMPTRWPILSRRHVTMRLGIFR
jgi:hypothetical protein